MSNDAYAFLMKTLGFSYTELNELSISDYAEFYVLALEYDKREFNTL